MSPGTERQASANGGGEGAGVRVVLVGHCVPDSYMLKTAVQRAVPGATILAVNSSEELDAVAGDSDLLLVNRVLDGYFRAGGGVELIRQLAGGRGGSPTPRIILISNIEIAQNEAREAGALPGFGKSELYSDLARSRLLAGVGGA